jgi:hypothetical protein
MSIEPFVYLTVFLFLTLLTFFARWLSEKAREEIHLRNIFGPSEKPGEPHVFETTQETTKLRQEPISTLPRPTSSRKLGTPLKISLHNKRGLRQGIVLMTVLGPCRALEPQQDVIF